MHGSIFFYSSSGDGSIEWVGSAMIWLQLFLSVANVVMIVLAFRSNTRDAILPANESTEFRALIASGRVKDAVQRTNRSHSDFAQVLGRALEHAPSGIESMTHAAEQAADELLAIRLRKLEPLNILGQVAPMIGLFGTVYGMIVAFQVIAATGGAADPALLAGGIGSALVTTFWGLFIAVPATSVYATVRNRTIARSDEMTALIEEMVALYRPKSTSVDDATSRPSLDAAAAGAP